MIFADVSPVSSRSSKLSNGAKMTPALVALVKVAPEKPAKATALATPGVLRDDLGGALDHRVGARERGAVGQLDDDDGVALVHRRDEAARHRLRSCRRSRRSAPAKTASIASSASRRADQEPHQPRIAVRPAGRSRG